MRSSGFGYRFIGVVLSLSLALGWVPASFAQQAASQPAAGATASGQGSKERVAVMELEAVGSTAVQASAMSDRLREELLNTGRYTLVDREQIDRVLTEQAFQQTACTSTECAVQVGKLLGVRKLVTGRVTKISEQQWLLSANMINVETAETERAPTLPFEGTYFALLTKGIGQLAAALAGTLEQVPVARTSAPSAGKASPPPAPVSAQGIGLKRVVQLASRLSWAVGPGTMPAEFRLSSKDAGLASEFGIEIVDEDTLPSRVKAKLDENAWSGVFNPSLDSIKLSQIGNQVGIQAFVACNAAYIPRSQGAGHTDCFLVDVLHSNDLKNGKDWNTVRGDTSEAVMEILVRDLLAKFLAVSKMEETLQREQAQAALRTPFGPKRVLQLPSRLSSVPGAVSVPTEFRLSSKDAGLASGLGIEIVDADTLPPRVKAKLDETAWSGVFNPILDSERLSVIGNQIGIQAFVACNAAYIPRSQGAGHTDCFLVDVLHSNDLKNGKDWNTVRGDTSEAVMEKLLRKLLSQFTSSK